MEELFTDVPENTLEIPQSEPVISTTPQQSSDFDSKEDSVQTEPTVSPEPTQSEQTPANSDSNINIDSSVSLDKDLPEEVENFQNIESEGVTDYSDYLIEQNKYLKEQNEYLKSIVSETQYCQRELNNIQNAMPGVMCILGLIVGLLLLQILASYIRP